LIEINYGHHAERFAMRPLEKDYPINILEGAVRSGKTWSLVPKNSLWLRVSGRRAQGDYGPSTEHPLPSSSLSAQAFLWCYRPELTSRHFLTWALKWKIELRHIQPGKPMQNEYVESFHGRLREECLPMSCFTNLFDARKKVALWKAEYDEQRRHSSLGYRTPAEFARMAITRS
jgi:hypothetical protein